MQAILPIPIWLAASLTASRWPSSGIGSPPRSMSCTRGPQAGHAFGWAWNRRLSGSSYSAWHSGHIWNDAIVVRGRSYGTPRTIVNRGPQLVQLMNG